MEAEWFSVTQSEEYKQLTAAVLPHRKLVLDGTLTPDALLNTALSCLPFCEYVYLYAYMFLCLV
jgi:hypothetical protein